MNCHAERVLLCEHGLELVRRGLVARTWGNLSLRIGEYMLITPSGLAYEKTRAEDIVEVRISDLAWEGGRKPSSEKELHALAYRLRPEVNAVFHTHQKYASALSVTRRSFPVETGRFTGDLGSLVPCAAYALPTSSALARSVGRVVKGGFYPAILLANHGAVCLGADAAGALQAAVALEEFSRDCLLAAWRQSAELPDATERELLVFEAGGGA